MALRAPLHAHDADDGDDERGGQTTQVAFEDLWQHRAALRDICQRIVGDAATADDVVQETYLRALRNLDSLERRPSLMPWLATVARRRSIDELRRRGYQHPVEEMPDEGTRPEYDPGETVAVNETVSQVREALTALTGRERDLLMRQVNQGLSLAELADSEDSSVASVRSVLSRARTKLRDALSDAGARVLAPLGALGGWLKRKTTDLNVKVQQASPLVGGSYDRFGEIATASVTAAALAVGGALVPAGAATGGGDETAIETVGVSGDEVSSVRDGVPTVLARPDADAAAGPTAVAGDADVESAPERSEAGTDVTSGAEPTLPTTDVSTNAPSDSPEPPPDQGEPMPSPSPAPEEPEDAEIVDLNAAVATPNGPMFAMGSYYGECASGSCAALFRSNDAGGSWTALEAVNLVADAIFVPPAFDGTTEKRLYAMGEKGLQRSTNGGASFHTVLGGPTFTGPAAISPGFNAGHDKIFLGTAPFWSYDASDNEAEQLGITGISGTMANFAFAPDYMDTGVLYAGSSMVTEGGTAWAVYTCEGDGTCEGAPLPEGFASLPNVVAYDDGPDRVVVAYTRSVMAVSVGEALEFSALDGLPLTGKIEDVTSTEDGALYVTFASTEAEHPNGGVAVSHDTGTTWEVLSTGTSLVHGVNAVAVAGSQVVAALSDQAGYGVMCSGDGGDSWASRCHG